MPKMHFLRDLATQLSEALPNHIGTFKNDFEKNCQHILARAFEKLDLVTREEFDTQTKVLLRSRKKLEELEARLKKLDTLLKNKQQK